MSFIDWIKVYYQEILTVFGGYIVLPIFVAYLFKTATGHWLSKSVDLYKSQLESQTQQEIESFKNELRRSAFEHETRFKRLDERRAEVVAEIYRQLSVVVREADSCLRFPMPQFAEVVHDENFKKAHNALIEFHDYYDAHRIYLESNIVAKLDELCNTTWACVARYDLTRALSDPKDYKSIVESVEAETKNSLSTVPDIRRELEREFKRILGVEERKG